MKFECQESCGGGCCKIPQGEKQFIFLTPKDQKLLTYGLNQASDVFSEILSFDSTRFTNKKGRYWVLKNNVNSCRFFVNGKCSVYEIRPTQCRTFPFWPENIKEGKITQSVVDRCPGVGKGSENGLGLRLLLEQAEADCDIKAHEGR